MNDTTVKIAFPLGTAGPFYELQLALRLAEEDRPNLGRRVLAAWLVTWLPLALLWWWQDVPVNDSGPAASVFTHYATYARFFVTLPLLIVAECTVRPYLERAFQHAVTAGVVPASRYREFLDLLVQGLRARESRLAEALILCLAVAVSHVSVSLAAGEHHASWIYSGTTRTWAGTWFAYISLPLLQFMIFRWLYRLSIWWRILRGLSRLGLNIQAAHPDARGGLAFLGDSIQAFAILALAFGAAAAGAVADFVVNEGAPIGESKGFIAGAALFVLLLFMGPLAFFIRPAYNAKDEALLRYEGLAQRYWLAFDRKWTSQDVEPHKPNEIAEPDFSCITDLGASVKAVREMKVFPITKEGVLPLLVAIALPFLPILGAILPVQQLLDGVVHVFLGNAE